jgi:hypothetical protein
MNLQNPTFGFRFSVAVTAELGNLTLSAVKAAFCFYAGRRIFDDRSMV